MLLLYSYYSNNFAGKIDASLDVTCNRSIQLHINMSKFINLLSDSQNIVPYGDAFQGIIILRIEQSPYSSV